MILLYVVNLFLCWSIKDEIIGFRLLKTKSTHWNANAFRVLPHPQFNSLRTKLWSDSNSLKDRFGENIASSSLLTQFLEKYEPKRLPSVEEEEDKNLQIKDLQNVMEVASSSIYNYTNIHGKFSPFPIFNDYQW